MGYLWDNYGIASYDVPQGSFAKPTFWLVEGVTTGCITPLVYMACINMTYVIDIPELNMEIKSDYHSQVHRCSSSFG